MSVSSSTSTSYANQGVNKGYIYEISSGNGGSSHLYIMQPKIFDIKYFSNIILETIWNSTREIYIADTQDESENVQLVEKIKLLIDRYPECVESQLDAQEIRELTDLVENCMNPADFSSPLLIGIVEELNIFIQKSPTHKFIGKLAISTLLFLNNFKLNLDNNVFIQRAKDENKSVFPILDSTKELEFSLEFLDLVFKNPATYMLIKFLLKDKAKGFILFSEILTYRFEGWSKGFSQKYISDNEKGFDLETNDKFVKFIQPMTMEEFTKLLDPLLEIHHNHVERSSSIVAEKISTLVKTKPNLLFLISESIAQEVLTALTGVKDCSVNSIRVPTKPIGLFWSVKNKSGKTLGYLGGSIHATPKRFTDFNKKVLQCFAKSEILGLEVDITRPEVLELKGKSTLRRQEKELNKLSPEEQKALRFQIEIIFMSKPEGKAILEQYPDISLAELLIWALFVLIKESVQNDSGIDLEFIRLANERKLSIVDLETVEEHEKAVDELNAYVINAEILKKIISSQESPENYKGDMFLADSNMFKIWENGDAKAASESTKVQSHQMKRSMMKRNAQIALSIDDLIQNKKKFFCVVGYLHTVGPQSVRDHLINLGYTTKQKIYEEVI